VLCITNVIGALLFLPCLPFTLAAGFLYGVGWGSLVVTIASNLAAVISFLTARYAVHCGLNAHTPLHCTLALAVHRH
jgi:uncharacterized membrane protein YdjX (TVP38/TMEM64 family)